MKAYRSSNMMDAISGSINKISFFLPHIYVLNANLVILVYLLKGGLTWNENEESSDYKVHALKLPE